MESKESPGVSTLQDYLQLLRRRKWVILQSLVAVPVAAVLISLGKAPVYQASAEVLLNRQNLAAELTGVDDPTLFDATRSAQTNAELARVPEVASRTLQAVKGAGSDPYALLDSSSVSPSQDSDLLTFRVRNRNPELATKLATAYAKQFISYRLALDASGLKAARATVQERLDSLVASENADSALYAILVEKEQQLRTMEALVTSRAVLVREAGGAAKVEPRPRRNAILAIGIGLVLGIGLAFLWEALDTRVRSVDTLTERLGLALLARLPTPARAIRKRNVPIMLTAPNDRDAEAYRMLRTNLDFVNLNRKAKAILITSAVSGEGKTTTAANLAVALARTGRRVTLVDADLRAASLHELFGLALRPGLTDVVLGEAALSEALVRIDITEGSPSTSEDEALPEQLPPTSKGAGHHGNGRGPVEGSLSVLTSGPFPPNPGEFISTPTLTRVFKDLRNSTDVLLVDGPPLLVAGDAMSLSALVDGLLLVSRPDVISRTMLSDLERLLRSTPVAKLGLVVTGTKTSEAYRYGRYAGIPEDRESRQPSMRKRTFMQNP